MSNNQDWEPVILINKKKMKEREKNDNSNKVAKPVSNSNKLTGSEKKPKCVLIQYLLCSVYIN